MRSLSRFKSLFDRNKAIRSAYATVFGSPEGKLVLHDLLRRTGILEASMVAGDPHMTHFRDGRRSVGLDVVHMLRWTEGEMMQLALQQTEAQTAQAAEED